MKSRSAQKHDGRSGYRTCEGQMVMACIPTMMFAVRNGRQVAPIFSKLA